MAFTTIPVSCCSAHPEMHAIATALSLSNASEELYVRDNSRLLVPDLLQLLGHKEDLSGMHVLMSFAHTLAVAVNVNT